MSATAFINSTRGALNPSDVGAVLPCEHVGADLSASKTSHFDAGQFRRSLFVDNGAGGNSEPGVRPALIATDGQIGIKDLCELKYNPFAVKQNLLLDNSEEVFHELESLKASVSELRDIVIEPDWSTRRILVVDLTDRHSTTTGLKNFQELTRRSDVAIVTGVCPQYGDSRDVSEMQLELEKKLLFGYDEDGSRAGVIGELHFDNLTEDQSQLKMLEAAVKAQASTGAPVFLSFSIENHSQLLHTALGIIKRHGGHLGKVVVCHMDFHLSNMPYVEEILAQGLIICFDCIGWAATFDSKRKIPHDSEIAKAVTELSLMRSSSYQAQILLSNGLSFRNQFLRYGGFGYGHVFRRFARRLLDNCLSPSALITILRDNPVRILSWYTPPPEPEKQVEFAICFWCKGEFVPIEGEYFTKFSYQYCGTKCLRKHRIAGFKPLD